MRAPILAGRSILIVEDEPLIALDVEVALHDVGAKVLSASHLRDGLHLAEHPGLSAAVLDLRLGHNDCTAICRRLSKLRVPFMFYSGYRGAHVYELWPNAPVLSRPANADRIVEAVVGMLPRAWPRRVSADARTPASAVRSDGGMDQATRFLRQALFDRSTMAMLRRVLEEGWVLVGERFKGVSAEQAGRMNMADGILALAKTGQRDPDVLKFYAISRVRNLLGPKGYYRSN